MPDSEESHDQIALSDTHNWFEAQAEHPELVVETGAETSDECIASIITRLVELGYLEPDYLIEKELTQPTSL